MAHVKRCWQAVPAAAIFLMIVAPVAAQQWASVLTSTQAIDWTNSGVGAIRARTAICANLAPAANVTQINAALTACPKEQAVLLAAGTYTISGTIVIPSNVTLRGAGANATILNAVGAAGGEVISLGSGSAPYAPVKIIGGAAAGSTSVTVANASGIAAGRYLVITETNDPEYVSSAGSEGNCNWCDGGWSHTGSLSRGQIVAVTRVSGSTIIFSPGLYGTYVNAPIAVPFNMAASYAGVENLQVRANNTGYAANFAMSACAYCWIRGVESNYTDGDHVSITWGYRDEVRDSYFSNAYLHAPGIHDADIQIAMKTSASLVENNIIERTHISVMLEWGAAGNVISYNYMMGEFDSGAPNVVIGGINIHGAHPQYNLIEGNVLTSIHADSVWGTSSQTTAFRNWVMGTNRVCEPIKGRGRVQCSGTKGHYGFQAARAIDMSYLATRNNFIGNVVGSTPMQSLLGYTRALSQSTRAQFPERRSYDAAVYAFSFGYGEANDDGSGTGCSGGIAPCHREGGSRTEFIHGNYNNTDKSVPWMPGLPHTLPPSFYLSRKPEWWGTLSYPATGPDITGANGPGRHSYGNPAQACYVKVMGGADGGPASPLEFNAAGCYGAWPTQSRFRPN